MIVAQLVSYNEVRDSFSLSIRSLSDEVRLKKIAEFCEKRTESDVENVIYFAQQGIALAEKLNIQTEQSRLWRFLGYGYTSSSQMNDAFTSFDKSLQIATAIGDSFNIIKTSTALGFYYDGIGEIDQAKILYNQALPMAKLLKEYKTQQIILCYKAIMLRREGKYDESMSLYNEILGLSRIHNLDSIAILRNKAQLHANMGNYSEALDIYYNIKKTSDPIKNHLLFADINHNIAFILKSNKLHKQALEYYHQVYAYFLDHQNFLHCSIINESIGEIKLEMNELDQAETYLLKGLDMRQEQGLGRTGTALEHLGLVKLKQNKYSEANDYLSMALDSFERVKNKRRIALTLCHLSQLYLQTNELEKSITFADSSRQIANTNEFDATYALALEHLIDAYKQIQNYEQVFILQQELDVAKKELEDPEKLFEISRQIVAQKVLDHKKHKTSDESASFPKWMFGGMLLLIPVGFWLFYVRKQNNIAIKSKKMPANSTHKTDVIPANEAEKLKKTLHDLMIKQKPYINTDLKLNDLASAIAITDKKLSALLNYNLNTSFYDYINQWRIQEFQKKAQEPNSKEFSITGLAYICGFKSKSSFYRCFKKEMGMSPSEYLKKLSS